MLENHLDISAAPVHCWYFEKKYYFSNTESKII